MAEDLVVRHANGATVGTITRTNTGARFTYDPEWRSDPASTPLSLSMPLSKPDHPNDVIEHFVWNVLPDNDRVLERWARDFNETAAHPFGIIEHVGADLPGAMQIVAADATSPATSQRTQWLSGTDVADRLKEVLRDSTAWISQGEPGHWSLAGAQPKIALLYDPKKGWGRPTGATPTTHILKPAAPGLVDHDLNEHLCLTAAGTVGLPAAQSAVQSFGDQRAIVVARYDRAGGQRIHQEDLCQALGLHPAAKYQHDQGPSPADIAAMFRRSMTHRDAVAAVERFVDGVIFNWVIGGTDAHAKNYSILLDGPVALFAPLYDVASAVPYTDLHFPKAKLAMKVGAHYRIASINTKAWTQFASEVGVDPDMVIDRARHFAQTVPDAFADAATVPAVTELNSPMPDLLVTGIEAHAQSCLRRLR